MSKDLPVGGGKRGARRAKALVLISGWAKGEGGKGAEEPLVR